MPRESKLLLTTSRFEVVEMLQSTEGDLPPRPRQIILHGGSVVILPLVDDDHICLIRNYRISVDETLIELPAGTIENNDPPLATAQRELEEETGYRATDWQQLPSILMSPGILSERNDLFVASGLTEGTPAREPGEQIENLVVPCDKALQMARDGRIVDAKTICTLLLWEKLRE